MSSPSIRWAGTAQILSGTLLTPGEVYGLDVLTVDQMRAFVEQDWATWETKPADAPAPPAHDEPPAPPAGDAGGDE